MGDCCSKRPNNRPGRENPQERREVRMEQLRQQPANAAQPGQVVNGRSWIWGFCRYRVRPLTNDIDRTRLQCLFCNRFIRFHHTGNMINHLIKIHHLDPRNLPPPPGQQQQPQPPQQQQQQQQR